MVDGRIYWDEGSLGLFGAVMTAPIAGGTPQSMFLGGDSTYVQTRLVIVDGVLDVMASGTVSGRVVWSAPLTPVGTVASTVYLRTGAHVTTIDADGTTVFFFEDSGTKDALNRTILDLDEVEPDSGGLGVLRLWPAAVAVPFPEYLFLVGDATTLYWSDGATISSFPNAPTATDVPTVVATLATPAGIDIQLLIDGPNLYALTPYQLLRVAKTGGAPVVLATSPDGTFDQSPTNALGMVVDDAFIYFLDAGHRPNSQAVEVSNELPSTRFEAFAHDTRAIQKRDLASPRPALLGRLQDGTGLSIGPVKAGFVHGDGEDIRGLAGSDDHGRSAVLRHFHQ